MAREDTADVVPVADVSNDGNNLGFRMRRQFAVHPEDRIFILVKQDQLVHGKM